MQRGICFTNFIPRSKPLRRQACSVLPVNSALDTPPIICFLVGALLWQFVLRCIDIFILFFNFLFTRFINTPLIRLLRFSGFLI
ncbi:hypothetical protein CSQ88_22515 [Iodobacter sp. BJB302]|nr:hypothetical protein CSQ88_22515 [Iodobacter sp. BJB302]